MTVGNVEHTYGKQRFDDALKVVDEVHRAYEQSKSVFKVAPKATI